MWLFDKIDAWFEGLRGEKPEHNGDLTVTVKKGDTLWRIAEDITGDGMNWKKLAEANPDKKWTADYLILPGDVLTIPKEWASVT